MNNKFRNKTKQRDRKTAKPKMIVDGAGLKRVQLDLKRKRKEGK